MRLLLDTCVFLWMSGDDQKLSEDSRAVIVDTSNELLLSAVSAWEIAIKARLHKLELPEPPETFVPSRMERNGVTPLPIVHAHALGTHRLPGHHADPFDRLLIAQAQHEGVSIVTPDRVFDSYDVDIVW